MIKSAYKVALVDYIRRKINEVELRYNKYSEMENQKLLCKKI